MKKQVFLKVFIATAVTAAIVYSQDALAATSTGSVGENYGSSAETYKELSPEMTLEQYENWLLQLKTALLKNKSGEAVSKNFQQVSSTIKWMEYLRKRALEVAKYESEMAYRPAKSASPNKSVGKDGSKSYSGRHAKVLKYIIENYSNLSKKDIQDINQRIASTPGKEWKKGFNVTFDAKIDDELGNTTLMPFTVTLKGDNHFPEWNYSKNYEPKAGILKGTDKWQSFLNEVYSWRDYSFGSWIGAWHAVGSKTKNAFGYSTGYRAETYNATENTITTVEESILDMDLSIREIKKVHRSIETKDLSSGIVGARYEETRETIEYKSRINKNGDIEYLPAVVEGTRYNFNADNEIESTSDFRSYTIYDDKGREEYALSVETQKDAQGNITGNTISGYSIKEYDPITGLTPHIYGHSFNISDIAGDFLRMTRYGDIAWRLLQDKDAYSRISQGAESPLDTIIAVALNVAKLVVDEGYDYEVAKINAISTLLAHNVAQDTLTTQGALY